MSENLTPEERQAINDLLSRPLDFPAKFKSWFIDYMAQNLPPLPVDHLEGYVKTRGYGDIVQPGAVSLGAGWQDLGGPNFDDIPGGTYLMLWGFYAPDNIHGGAQYKMGPIVDGVGSPSEDNACKLAAGETGGAAARARVIDIGSTSVLNQGSLDFRYRADTWSGTPSGTNIHSAWATIVRLA